LSSGEVADLPSADKTASEFSEESKDDFGALGDVSLVFNARNDKDISYFNKASLITSL